MTATPQGSPVGAPDLAKLTSTIVSAYLAKHNVPISDVPTLIRETFAALARTGDVSPAPVERTKPEPAVPVKKSIDKDGEWIVCLEDGKKFKSLRRHLMTHFGMTPDEYRQKWGLPFDYPMVAPKYAEQRSRLAMKMGLGKTRFAA